jgi:hypothetical protein
LADVQLKSFNRRLITVLAKLETSLPLCWNTSTRHYLLHICEQLEELGNFWAISMLGVERLHVLIKHLAKGRKNIMASIQNKYELFSDAQITWRHDTKHKWTNTGYKSTFAFKLPLPKCEGKVCLKGKQRIFPASDNLFEMLQDQWAILNRSFDIFRDKYYTYRRNNVNPVSFAKWENNNDDEKSAVQEANWQKMDRTVWEIDRCTLDGVLFRTRRSQDRKGTRTDNSCIVGYTNVVRDERRQRGARTKEARAGSKQERCYGVIDRLYLHFMYPPTAEALENATYKRKIDPATVGVPWAIFASCHCMKIYLMSIQSPN